MGGEIIIYMEKELLQFKSVLEKLILSKYGFIYKVNVSMDVDGLYVMVKYYMDDESFSYRNTIIGASKFNKVSGEIRRETNNLFKMMGSDIDCAVSVRFINAVPFS